MKCGWNTFRLSGSSNNYVIWLTNSGRVSWSHPFYSLNFGSCWDLKLWLRLFKILSIKIYFWWNAEVMSSGVRYRDWIRECCHWEIVGSYLMKLSDTLSKSMDILSPLSILSADMSLNLSFLGITLFTLLLGVLTPFIDCLVSLFLLNFRRTWGWLWKF